MTTQEVVLKEIAPVRVAELTAVAASYQGEDIGPVIQPLYPELFRRLAAAGDHPTGPSIAWYEPAAAATATRGRARRGDSSTSSRRPPDVDGGATCPRCAPPRRSSTMVRWTTSTSMQALARWIDENGYRTDGFAREVYLDSAGQEKGVTSSAAWPEVGGEARACGEGKLTKQL